MSSQPKALYLLNFVSMWECFSYYGMRVLLVLYMVHKLQYSDEKAFGMYALYTTLVELGGVLGGMVADRFLGLKRSIIMGGITIAFGHICMTLPDSQTMFLLGLGFIIAGTSLFRSNVAAFLGEFYEENDPRRDAGYTLYYTGINLGGFLAAIACGFVGEVYGWHAGFGLAAIGMLSGLVVLFLGRNILGSSGKKPLAVKKATGIACTGLLLAGLAAALMIYCNQVMTPLVPIAIVALVYYIYRRIRAYSPSSMKAYSTLALYLLFLVLFYGCEEQLGSTLVLFAERHVDRQTYFGIIPAASLVTFNPLTILVLGPLFSSLLQKVPLAGLTKIGFSFAFLGGAFCLLYLGGVAATLNQEVPLGYAILSIALISAGELLIGPTVYAKASELAPKALSGLMMGTVSLGYSLANLLSGFLSQLMAVTETDLSLEVYTGGFGGIGAGACVLALTLFLISKRRKEVAL